MDITLIGASDMFARDFATWAVAGEQNVTVVGPGIAKPEAFMRDIGAAKAAGRRAPLTGPRLCITVTSNFKMLTRALTILLSDNHYTNQAFSLNNTSIQIF